MLFNSLQFALFFPCIVVLYFTLPERFRNHALLVASCVFYMAAIPKYILILFGTIVVDYIAGLLIERNQGRRRKAWLVVSICANVGALGVFKYFNFFVDNVNSVLGLFGAGPTLPFWRLILPVGLSFHTFQAMAYTIEVYRGDFRAERDFVTYALYVMFFPQLVAGPIERPQNLLPQFRIEHKFDHERAVSGLRRMIWGLFKKVVIADRLALFIDPVYAYPGNHDGPVVLLAALAYAFQIYCDFSGYTDLALGSARVLGFNLIENFNRPFFSTSIADYWRRWHISLSTWFNDYLFIPLAMGPRWFGSHQWQFALFLTFFLSGVWHGAAWHFVLYGVLNGLYILLSHWTLPAREWLVDKLRLERVPRLLTALNVATTFPILVLTWIVFRATSMSHVAEIFRGLVRGGLTAYGPAGLDAALAYFTLQIGGSKAYLSAVVVGVFVLQLVEYLHSERILVQPRFGALRPAVRWAAYYVMVMVILLYGSFASNQFIYFQF